MKSENLLKKLNGNLYIFLQNFIVLMASFFEVKEMNAYLIMIAIVFVLNFCFLELKIRMLKFKKRYTCYIFEDTLNFAYLNCAQVYIIEFITFIYFVFVRNLNLKIFVILFVVCICNSYYLQSWRKYEQCRD